MLQNGQSVKKRVDLDYVLINELGQFGKYQLRNLILVSFPFILIACANDFIFTAAALKYRCKVPECEGNTTVYQTEWTSYAIPQSGSGFSSCERYTPLSGDCSPTAFNLSSLISCEEYVYATTNSIVYDFGLECQEWLRTLAGTMTNIGALLVLPVTGFISDRFGRKVALIINVFNLCLFSIITSFSVNYTMFLFVKLLATTLGGGIFSTGYIFAAELVGPKYRVAIGAFCFSIFACGHVVLASVAWLVQSWRYLLISIYTPGFLLISYYWIFSESVRWQLSKQKYDEARKVLENVAKVNKKVISEESMLALMTPPPLLSKERPSLMTSVVKSRVLLRRVCTTPVWWVTTTFVYYGLSINSVSLSGNMYLNYIFISIVEIPGYILSVFVLGKIGRKPTLSGGFFLSAACNFVVVFVSNDVFKLVLYLLGKFGIAIVFTSLYLYTSELYPTEYRHSLLAFSSMIGRIGAIFAPQTPALMIYWTGLPSILFGTLALVSGLLVLTQPETLGTKLPDTLAEAESLEKNIDIST